MSFTFRHKLAAMNPQHLTSCNESTTFYPPQLTHGIYLAAMKPQHITGCNIHTTFNWQHLLRPPCASQLGLLALIEVATLAPIGCEDEGNGEGRGGEER